MRLSYSEDESYPGQFELWQANCRRSLRGRRGQAALRELEAALLALPQKRLIRGDLEDAEGQGCAVGALARYKRVPMPDIVTPPWENEPVDAAEYGETLGLPRLVAWSVVAENDMVLECRTPEARYSGVLYWVQEQLRVGGRAAV